ncbi:glycoside hydrolase superfamily [Obelidium mucronatum]|nr:glycoside hydrolase superfamily [Obelidium mucronatum]
MLALCLGLLCLLYFSWKIYNLHISATPANSPTKQVPILDPITGIPALGCQFDASKGFARVQPQIKNSIILGFSLDWSYETPSMIRQKMKGYTPVIFNAFMDLDAIATAPYDAGLLNWFGSEVGRVGGILEITMMPTSNNPTSYSDEILDRLARDFSRINSFYGTPILLRFGSEMNGDWFVYGNQPMEFVRMFRRVTEFVRKHTNMTAMVWGPNIGITYPFVGGGSTPIPTSGPNFIAMDTNNDGEINSLDDPYTPFYPGDDVVDWVALSLYYYPFADCRNCPVPSTYFKDYLTGTCWIPNLVTDLDAYQRIHDFYHMFCTPESHNKPMLLPETGSPYVPAYRNSSDVTQWSEVDIKMAWWKQVLNSETLHNFPNLVAAVNFEESKIQGSANLLQDWKLTNTTSVLQAFMELLFSFEENLHQGHEFEYGCDGSVIPK